MKTLKVKLKSIAPLLMNRRPDEDLDNEELSKKDKSIDLKSNAEKSAWRDSEIGYYVPAEMIEGCLREAGKNFKMKSNKMKTYKKTVLSSVYCVESKIPLNRHDYDEIDKRWGVLNGRSQIAVHRVKFNKWEIDFHINYDENRIDEKTIKTLLKEGGEVIGIGSYRPKFGRFESSIE